MADLGNRANLDTAINTLLDDAQPNEAIQPSDHNTLLKNALDTVANGLPNTLRTNPETSGNDLQVTSGDKVKFKHSTFFGSIVSGTLTADRTYTLPDNTGTLALLSDITGGDSIYTADGAITGDRAVDLDSNKLTFRTRTNTTTDRIETIYNNSPVGGAVVDHYDKFSTIMHSVNRDSFGNLAYAVGFYRSGCDVGPKSAIKMRGFSTTDSYIKFSNQFGDKYSQIGASVPHYFLKATGTLATNKFIVGNDSVVATENISFQGSTLIKGDGTSTGSALSLYDNDTTPNKRFEILDNGQFRLDSSNAVVATPFKIEMRPLGGTGTPPYFMIKNYGEVEIYGGLSNLFNVQNTLGAKQFEVLNGTTKINGSSEITASFFKVSTDTQKMSFNAGSGGALHHEIKTNGGGGPITTRFNIPGGTSEFIVGGSAVIGTEKISLQGDTLLNANVNMSNLPTSSAGLSSGDLYNDGGTLKIV